MGWLGVTLKQVLTRVRAGGWRCHSDVITVRDDTGWQGAGDVTHRKHAEEFEENKSRVLDAKREESILELAGARRTRALWGAARVEGQMNKTA